MDELLNALQNFWQSTGLFRTVNSMDALWWQTLVMIGIVVVLVYLAIVKGFEPLLLLPIAVGMLLTNLPGGGMFHSEYWFCDITELNELIAAGKSLAVEGPVIGGHVVPWNELYSFTWENGEIVSAYTNFNYIFQHGGLLDLLYIGVKTGIYPCLIFIGIGAMTDFTPLISNPKSLLIGAGAQLGVFVAFAGALISGVFTGNEAASIGIIGGADGPTAITVTKSLAPGLLGAIAIAAYSYMALIPMIQPPIMKLLTTEKERKIKMTALRPVSKAEKIIFPILVMIIVGLIVPDALVLIGCLMFGNLMNVCGVTDRLSKTAQNGLMNTVTICLGISVGATATAASFLDTKTLLIIVLGLTAFLISTTGGLLTAKLMNVLTGGKINPLIGSAGVSAVPMAARVSQIEGQKADPSNFLLMHAMGPNVAGVIGSAVAAGVLMSFFG